jgi:hypothetical protein
MVKNLKTIVLLKLCYYVKLNLKFDRFNHKLITKIYYDVKMHVVIPT